jgi:hypothetical protein
VLLDLLRDIIARHAPIGGIMKFQSQTILVPSDNSSKFTFLLGLENG